jgi:hypothetical protein
VIVSLLLIVALIRLPVVSCACDIQRREKKESIKGVKIEKGSGQNYQQDTSRQ